MNADRAEQAANRVLAELGAQGVDVDANIAKVSLIGAGMRSHPGVAADMFRQLAENQINIEMISTSPVRISCIIAADRCEEAVKALHDYYLPPDDPVTEAGS